MISDKAKVASALLSLSSVVFVMLGAVSSSVTKTWLPSTLDAFYIALAGAIMSSVTSLVATKSIRRNRQARHIFIVYSHKDRSVAKEIAGLLRDAGFDPWLDEEKLLPGQNWNRALSQAISKSGAALILLSENFYASQSTIKELDRVSSVILSRDKDVSPILPIRLDSAEVPSRLAEIQWIDWRDANAQDKLLYGLSFITGQPINEHSR